MVLALAQPAVCRREHGVDKSADKGERRGRERKGRERKGREGKGKGKGCIGSSYNSVSRPPIECTKVSQKSCRYSLTIFTK